MMVMNHPLVTSPHDLPPQLANLRAHWLAWGDGSCEVGADLSLYRSGIQHGLFNGVLRVHGRDPGEAAAEAEEALSGVPWNWWIGPDSDPGVAEVLQSRGYTHRGAMPVMAADLTTLPRPSPPPGLIIEEATDRRGITDYVNAYSVAFGFADEVRAAATAAELALRTDLGTLIRLVGYLDGQPVATAAAVLSHGVAGLYWIGTAAGHRSRGLGAALTAAAMSVARQRGMSVCTLQASGLGRPVYARLGFAEVGQVDLYAVPGR